MSWPHPERPEGWKPEFDLGNEPLDRLLKKLLEDEYEISAIPAMTYAELDAVAYRMRELRRIITLVEKIRQEEQKADKQP